MDWEAAYKWLGGVAGSTLVATLLATGLSSILQRWVGRDLAATQSMLENKKLLYTRELAAYEALALLAGQSYIWDSHTVDRDRYEFHATDEEKVRMLMDFLVAQNKRISEFWVNHSAFVPQSVRSELDAATNTGTFSPEMILTGECMARVHWNLADRQTQVQGMLLNARNRMWGYLLKRVGEPEPPFVDSIAPYDVDYPDCPKGSEKHSDQ